MIMGKPYFEVGSNMLQGVTQITKFADVSLYNDVFRVIDTQGYCDPEGKDYHNSQQMLKVLNE